MVDASGNDVTVYTGTTLRDGVYCTNYPNWQAEGKKPKLEISTQYTSGNVTFVADYQIEISASDVRLSAYHPSGLLAYSYGPDDVSFTWQGSSDDPDDIDLSGIVYAPNGTASYSGSGNNTLNGAIIADQIQWSGQGLTLDASGLSGESTPDSVALIE